MQTPSIFVARVGLRLIFFCNFMMDESSGYNSLMVLPNESKHEITSISPPVFCGPGESSVERTEGGSFVSSIEESIEKSKSHWSQVRKFDSNNEVAEVSNVKLFKNLQRHPTWGSFFMTFGEREGSVGELVMGMKFGQAKLYEVQIQWNDPKLCEDVLKYKREYALKVFKKGTFLQDLQSQWPHGMLQFHANRKNLGKLGLSQLLRFDCDVYCGTLLEDGRFAFVMGKEEEDLRSMIDQEMLTRPKDKGPFSKDDVEFIIYGIALGMFQLHGRGIIHRDIKASNVLVTYKKICYIADFECSVGVVGTGFFRAPEILEACKLGNVNKKIELFTKAVDVYGYAMICYEILTGKLPFEGHPRNEYDFVLEGQRPELPQDVDDWLRKLLGRCWQSNPIARPSFGDILKVLVANSTICREQKLALERQEVVLEIRKDLGMDSRMAKLIRSLRVVKWKMMCWIRRNSSS